ncbi:hypothetical protein [Methylobrevis albus]|uniref:hypothetical protein n=1 Tax=Methylobrevis albus TaxID=2793297 RepID=UPI001F3D5DAD|nr:hypothetical protein [Methylobrevis albus]
MAGAGTRRAPRPETLLARMRRTLGRQVEELEKRFADATTVEEKDARTLATLARALDVLMTLENDAGRGRAAADHAGDGRPGSAGRELPVGRDGAAAAALRGELARRLEALCADGPADGGAG